MRITFGVARSLAAAAALLWMCAASAQSPAVNAKEADEAKQQAAQQIVQPLNNQPVWNEVRSGQPQSRPCADARPTS